MSIEELHNKNKSISFEQRMRKQLLWLMYLLSRDRNHLQVPDMIVFRVPNKIGPVFKRSPYNIGTKLWNLLSRNTQNLPCVFAFKKKIAHNYRKLH